MSSRYSPNNVRASSTDCDYHSLEEESDTSSRRLCPEWSSDSLVPGDSEEYCRIQREMGEARLTGSASDDELQAPGDDDEGTEENFQERYHFIYNHVYASLIRVL